MTKKEIAAILRAIADLIERTKPSEIKNLVKGAAHLVVDYPKRGPENHDKNIEVKINWETVKRRLEAARSTDQGLQVLREEGVIRRRRNLEELARLYDVATSRSESVSMLAQHIADTVVGSKIYSETIQNLDLRSNRKTRKVS